MSTHSAIGIQIAHKIKGIYCNFDGYPSYVGKILIEHYDIEKTFKLVELGNLSSLGQHIGCKHDFNCCPADTCNFYFRDREEDWDVCKPLEFDSIEDFIDVFADYGCDYFYILVDNEWNICYNGNMKKLVNEFPKEDERLNNGG